MLKGEIDGDLKNELDELNRMENEKLRIAELESEKNAEKENNNTNNNIQLNNNNRQQSIIKTRSKANVLQEKNAIQVVSHNDRLLGKASIGDTVVFFSSEFDRGIADPPNILCKVIDIDSHMNYQLACTVGILDKYMARNAFQLVQDTVDFQISREKMISPREAVRLLSIGNGQGFIMCECNGQCKTKRCKCFKMALKCKSRCHGMNKSCANKE